MDNPQDRLFDFLISRQGLIKIGLLFSNQIYEVRFTPEKTPVGGDIVLRVLKSKIEAAAHVNGILVLIYESPLKLMARQADGQLAPMARSHLAVLSSSEGRWASAMPWQVCELWDRDRRLKIITRLEEHKRLDVLPLPGHVQAQSPGAPQRRTKN